MEGILQSGCVLWSKISAANFFLYLSSIFFADAINRVPTIKFIRLCVIREFYVHLQTEMDFATI